MKLILSILLFGVIVHADITKHIKADFGATCDGSVHAADTTAFTNATADGVTWTAANPGQWYIVDLDASTCVPRTNFGGGVKKLKWINGAVTDLGSAGNQFAFGSVPYQTMYADNLHNAAIATVAAGATSVTLLDAAKASRFTVDTWNVITGIDLQGSGFPPNVAFWDFVYISNISGATITFATTPLSNTYKSTWPTYNTGSGSTIDFGGPGNLYALPPNWDQEVVIDGVTITQTASQTLAAARLLTFKNLTVNGSGLSCIFPSLNMAWVVDNVTIDCGSEVDKIIDTVTCTNTNITGHWVFQSSSVKNFNMSGCSGAGIVGTPIRLSASNSSFTDFGVGATGYGRTLSVSCTICTITNPINYTGVTEYGEPDGAGVNHDYSITNGVIKVPTALGPMRWAVPGANLFFSGPYLYESFPFRITDITQDATYVYIATTLAGGWPSVPLGGGPGGILGLQVHPAPTFTCITCTGNASAVDLSQAGAQGKPLFSYTKRTYSGNIGTSQPLVKIWGTIVSASINVTTPYTGVQSTLTLDAMGNSFVGTIKPDGSLYSYIPVINLKTTGERVVTQAGVTGTQTGDSALSVPSAISFNVVAPYLGTDISGEGAGVKPTFTIEIVTDQSPLPKYVLSGKTSQGGKVTIQ